jgi:hypothetical protein
MEKAVLVGGEIKHTKEERLTNTKRIQNKRMKLANQWEIPDKSKHPQGFGMEKGKFRKSPVKCQCRRCRLNNPKNNEKGKNKDKWSMLK